MKKEEEQGMSESRVQRITRMEQALNEAAQAVSALDRAIEGYRGALERIGELRRYYESDEWMEDVKADEDGKLPENLPRGVLTEDAIYDLLTDQVRLREVFREMEQKV
jgi:hypothetical protein